MANLDKERTLFLVKYGIMFQKYSQEKSIISAFSPPRNLKRFLKYNLKLFNDKVAYLYKYTNCSEKSKVVKYRFNSLIDQAAMRNRCKNLDNRL
jgi:hypothetical protein